MRPGRGRSVSLVLGLIFLTGCSSHSGPGGTRHHHRGPKVNLADLLHNPAAYKGKSIMLVLQVDEDIDRGQGQSLRDYVGRDVKFTTVAAGGERLDLVITIPQGLSVPDVGRSEEVSVTFVCTRGDLRQGNEARLIER
jgi:hypothetical protein